MLNLDLERFLEVWEEILSWFRKVFEVFKGFLPSSGGTDDDTTAAV